MKKIFNLFLFTYSFQAFSGGSSGIGPAGKQISLIFKNASFDAVYIEDSEYIELLSKVGSPHSIQKIGELNFNSNIWVDSLVIENQIPLIRSFSENGDELFFISHSTLGQNFQMVIPKHQAFDLFNAKGGSTIQPAASGGEGGSIIEPKKWTKRENLTSIWQQIPVSDDQ